MKKGIPQAEKVKAFLEASRADALKLLVEAWKSSQNFDELRLIPSLICEGEWKSQPQVTREFLLDLVNVIPQNKWWSIPAFLRAIKEKYPDFQRPAGDYNSWFIKRASDGQYLRGFAYWDQVDGALVKHFIQTLHWLGMADLAAPEEGKDAAAFQNPVESRRSKVRPSTFDLRRKNHSFFQRKNYGLPDFSPALFGIKSHAFANGRSRKPMIIFTK